MYTILFILVLFSGTTAVILNQAKFGKSPTGERLERIRKSVNYNNGSFQNQSFTPVMAEDVSYFAVIKEVLFSRSKRNSPKDILPSKKTNLLTLDPETDVLVWFGHSSYFMQIDGKKILVDPVMSGHASPFSFTVKSFGGSDVYSPDDFPEIDYLFITHDHWDHLDYKTVLKLKPKVGKIITSLGTGAHLEHWGFAPGQILEKNWNESAVLDSGVHRP